MLEILALCLSTNINIWNMTFLVRGKIFSPKVKIKIQCQIERVNHLRCIKGIFPLENFMKQLYNKFLSIQKKRK